MNVFVKIVKRFVLCGTALFLLLGCQPKASPPNIILIVADDLGYGDLGCYGNTTSSSPFLDQMAAKGLRFTDFHANGPVCSPTRAALMTGQYQQRTGISGVVTAGKYRDQGLDTSVITLAKVLRAQGYRTALFGKWHLGYDTIFSPLHHGFDVFRGFVSGNIDYHSHIDQAGVFDWWWGKEFKEEPGYTTDLITQHALDFIKQNEDQPFFLFLSHEAPHYPYQGRADTADRQIGHTHPAYGSRTDREVAYQEMITAMDEGIGQVVALIEQQGQADNTLIFFCSDNGAAKTGSNAPLRGLKGKLWEGGHRVPAIAYWPGKIASGTTGETALTMDLFPTFAEAAGAPIPDFTDGISLLPLLTNVTGALPDRPLFWQFKADAAIRQGLWKLIYSPGDTFLFNLEKDIRENNNLSDAKPQLRDSMMKSLRDWESEMASYPVKTQ
jgi:arylsulfatase A-like enzyme